MAAKTLLQTGQFEVTVYEQRNRIGGIWALDRNSTNGFLSPYTPTNLSRFTVGFSDLDWNSVDYSDHHANGAPNGDSTGKVPMFPKVSGSGHIISHEEISCYVLVVNHKLTCDHS